MERRSALKLLCSSFAMALPFTLLRKDAPEPSAISFSLPFTKLPSNLSIRGPCYPVSFNHNVKLS